MDTRESSSPDPELQQSPLDGPCRGDPESTYSAAFVPPNVMGLNTSPNAATGVNLLPFLANYSTGHSTTLAPDLLAKIAYGPGWGHFEIKTLGRLFRDRIAATATSSGHTNTTAGYGVGFVALMPFANKRLEVSLEGLAGQGVGRYGADRFADVTLDPTTGEMRPLRQARVMAGVVYHHGGRLDVYAYGGDSLSRASCVPLTRRDCRWLWVSARELRQLHERSGAEWMPRRQSKHL